MPYYFVCTSRFGGFAAFYTSVIQPTAANRRAAARHCAFKLRLLAANGLMTPLPAQHSRRRLSLADIRERGRRQPMLILGPCKRRSWADGGHTERSMADSLTLKQVERIPHDE